MPTRRTVLHLVLVPGLAASAAGCASLAGRDPLQVQVAGIEPLPGQGLEWRMLLKLRVQNPNEEPLDYDGASVQLDLRGEPFATGVTDARGSVPRFGEAVIALPVTVSALRAARQVFDLATSSPPGRLDYVLRGKLAGAGLGATRFESAGELSWPPAARP